MRNANAPGTNRLTLTGDLTERVWIRWAGEDDLDRPERGRKGYIIEPVPWPAKLGVPGEELPIPEGIKLPKGGKFGRGGTRIQMALANVPRWLLAQLGGAGLPDELQREYDALQQRLARIAEDV